MNLETEVLRSKDDTPGTLDRNYRLYQIERALKFDPQHPDRRALIREFLDLTEPVEMDNVL